MVKLNKKNGLIIISIVVLVFGVAYYLYFYTPFIINLSYKAYKAEFQRCYQGPSSTVAFDIDVSEEAIREAWKTKAPIACRDPGFKSLLAN